MRAPNLATLLEILEISQPYSPTATTGRYLQGALPDYTSPPLPEALAATPEAFRSNATISVARDLDAAGLCVGEKADENAEACQMIFTPVDYDGSSSKSKVGVIFFGGALVDPRGYSPLLRMLSDTYELPVSVPIFTGDMAFKFGTCESSRLHQAQKVFPDVERWIFAGHSFGGIAAFNDVWAMDQRNETDAIAGIVMLGSYIRQDLGCGMSDFSGRAWDWLSFASVPASEDGVVNATNFAAGQPLLPTGPNFRNVIIEGGNHGGFGTYDYSERVTLLSQVDGEATISKKDQQEQTADVFGEIAALSELIGADDTSVAGNAILTDKTEDDTSNIAINITLEEQIGEGTNVLCDGDSSTSGGWSLARALSRYSIAASMVIATFAVML